MSTDGRGYPTRSATIDLAIRLGFLALLAYWSVRVVAPFATIGLWSAILAVALYPLYKRLAQRLSPALAAALVTLLCLAVVLGPVTWLGLGMISGTAALVTEVNKGPPVLPFPPESIKTWPIIGEKIHQLWNLAVSNLRAALTELLPLLKPVGAKLIDIAQGAFVGLLELLVAIVVAGFLFPRGPQIADALSVVVGRALSLRGRELVELSGATVRNVARGVIGIALLQAFLGGVGFLLAGIPAASALAFFAFLLGIIQIGPALLFIPIVIWSWTAMESDTCPPVHRLHGPRRPHRQRPSTTLDGARVDHSDAGDLDRRHWRHRRVRDRWTLLWSARSVCRVGCAHGLATRDRRRTPARKHVTSLPLAVSVRYHRLRSAI
jgi:predicted PurR-regulated permease PerM